MFLKQMTLGLIHFFIEKPDTVSVTPKVYDDSMSDETATSSGGYELIKIEIQMFLLLPQLSDFEKNLFQ